MTTHEYAAWLLSQADVPLFVADHNGFEPVGPSPVCKIQNPVERAKLIRDWHNSGAHGSLDVSRVSWIEGMVVCSIEDAS